MWASRMKSNVPVGAEPLIAERSRLENLLQASEDWRALQQLRSRTERGEGLSAVSSQNLEAMLVDALAENPFFGPYKSVCLAIDRLSNGQVPNVHAKSGVAAVSNAEPSLDNLTRIRGVDGTLARRLKDMDITTFAEIAEWRSSDIQRVSSELGVGKQIYGQNWIEQAALLALTSPNKAPKKQVAAKPPAASSPAAGQSPGAAAIAAITVDVPEIDPNQLTLNFSKSAAKLVKPDLAANQAPPLAPAPKAGTSTTPGVIAPSQPVAPMSAPVATAAAAQAPSRAVGLPPKPLVPWHYGRAPDAPARPLPPQPIKIATASPVVISEIPVSQASAPSSASTASKLVPPRPLVITRASLEALAKSAAAIQIPAPAATPQVSSAGLPPLIPQTVHPQAAPPHTAASADAGIPVMSIAEALAYAAEVARDEKRPGSSDAAKTPSSGGSPSGPPASLRDALMQSATPSVSTATAAAAAAAAAAIISKTQISKSSASTSSLPPVLSPVLPPGDPAVLAARAPPRVTPPAPPVMPKVMPPVMPPPLPAAFVAPEVPPGSATAPAGPHRACPPGRTRRFFQPLERRGGER